MLPYGDNPMSETYKYNPIFNKTQFEVLSDTVENAMEMFADNNEYATVGILYTIRGELENSERTVESYSKDNKDVLTV